jgi:hypothetical protein
MNTYTKSNRENAVFRCTRHYGSALYSYMAESLGRIVKRIVRRGAGLLLLCYDMEVGENRARVFYGTEKREGERLEIYGRDISPCSSHRVSDL